jgi:GxxExxY protein
VLQHQALTERIIGLAIEVRRKTGPGLLESVYAACLCFELEHAGIPLSRQVYPLCFRHTRRNFKRTSARAVFPLACC